ncbi:MAG: hypothetical protein K0M56_00440 [Kaistella sp.]|nr:hypothetical protein [Kaistella sp.]
MCINVYEKKETDFDLIREIQNGLLNANHFQDLLEEQNSTGSIYGSIDLSKLKETDFSYVDTAELEKLFVKLWSEDGWGDDLPIFQKNFLKTKEWFDSIKFKSEKHFFLNKGWLNKDVIIDPDFFGYLTVVISISDDQIGITTFGMD